MLDIAYEYSFYSISSSNRDEDLNSDLDKFESFLKKDDAALYLQNKVACRASMENIERLFGPFSKDEINFYFNALANGSHTITINGFQREMVFKC